jgi:hypothetical protein
MMPALRVLVVAAAIVSQASAPACAAGGGWPDLARRIAGGEPVAQMRVTVGAEPPAFVFPVPARPALRIVGSTWFASGTNAPPEIAHIYYAPASRTRAAWDALYSQLVAAGYRRREHSDYVSPVDPGDDGVAEHMCPADLRRPALDLAMSTVDGLPALDVQIRLHAASTSCRSVAMAPRLDAHAAVLSDIPGLTFSNRLMTTDAVQASPYSTGTVRTALPARDAVAKIAERFVAKGWAARPASVGDDTITQRFELVETTYRWDALLVFDRRADGLYEVVIAIADSISEPSGR